jgi:predicted O-methyltransferase YrrM
MLDFRVDTIARTTKDLFTDCPQMHYFNDMPQAPGKEHYWLLASLSIQLSNKSIIELGTHTGNSAYMLSYGNRKLKNNNKIITFDITDKSKVLKDTVNVDYRIEDMFDPVIREKNRELLLTSDMIFIDIDPHEGIMEYDMYVWLKDNDYKGIIMFDDIHLGPGHMGVTSGNSMTDFWNKVDARYKIDLTSVGHWSGTGLVCFNLEEKNILY